MRSVVGSIVFVWLVSHAEVSRADDTRVVEAAQSEASDKTASDGSTARRHWRRADVEHPPDFQTPHPPPESYIGWLIASYMTLPVLAIGLPIFIGETGSYDTGATVAFVGGLAVGATLPAVVHWVNGATKRGVYAIVGVPLFTAGGALAGAMIGAELTSDAEERNDEDATLKNGLRGALIGSGIVFAAWATIDVIGTANAFEKRTRSAGNLRFAVAPAPGGAIGTVAGRF
jgi:hypothetical protein